MFFESSIEEDLKVLMHNCVSLKLTQLRKYYLPVLKKSNDIDFYVKKLGANAILKFDEIDGDVYLHYRLAPKMSQYLLDASIQCFWVIANFGCKRILSIEHGAYPMMYGIITDEEDGQLRADISYIKSEQDLISVYGHIRNSLPKGVEDISTHIAVLEDESLAQLLPKYGFDYWTSFDSDRTNMVLHDVEYDD